MDHDQRFKTLIRVFFLEFLRLFFARWLTGLDLSKVDWCNQELFPDPPTGTQHILDLVGRVNVAAVPSAPPSALLLHVEIESPDRKTALTPRLPSYHRHLCDRDQLPVLTLVLYLKVGLGGIGVDSVIEEVQGLEVNRFQYAYVGLPALDALQYVQGDNWLGVALSALMRIPPERVVEVGAEALRRLAAAPLTEYQRFLLCECVQAYLPLDAAQKQELEQLLQTEPYQEVSAMNETMYEKGLRTARLELVSAVCDTLQERFGPIAAAQRTALEQLSMAELYRLSQRLATAATLADVGLPSAT